MVSKLPRYRLQFGYVIDPNDDRTIYGTLDEHEFSFKELEYFLKILSPINSISWIESIKCLRRKGFIILKFKENTDYGIAHKALRITRN